MIAKYPNAFLYLYKVWLVCPLQVLHNYCNKHSGLESFAKKDKESWDGEPLREGIVQCSHLLELACSSSQSIGPFRWFYLVKSESGLLEL